jgi:hypothetical protein
MSRLISFIFALAALFGGATAIAAPAFAPLPTLDNKTTKLTFRVVEYKGGTNGKMIVDVKNEGTTGEEFEAKGLYFVPKGDPEVAPQRLGAAGPFQARRNGKWEPRDKLRLEPQQVARLELDVFCIDSHRSSPSSSTKFDLASERLPSELSHEIETGTKALLEAKKVHNARDASSEVQSHIWQTRNKKWLKLHGERADEKKQGSIRNHHQQLRR